MNFELRVKDSSEVQNSKLKTQNFHWNVKTLGFPQTGDLDSKLFGKSPIDRLKISQPKSQTKIDRACD
ncbi:MAG: hypothetical protein MUE44_26310 [Oscillatoriaceae cyanobacterium Prado104]|nr:hypothetical protein [Oscillatoriaceae cyanobacterium Prado104]